MPKKIIFVLGPPGAGKGTQCQLLAQKHDNVLHLSVGQLLREEREKGGVNCDIINSCIGLCLGYMGRMYFCVYF